MEKTPDFRPEHNSKKREIFSDEQTDQRVHRHIEDEDDMITDQDLENIKTEMTPATLEDEKEAARKEGFSEEEIAEIDEDDEA